MSERKAIRTVTYDELQFKKKLKFGIQCMVGEPDQHEGKTGEQVALALHEPLTVAIAQVCKAWGFTDPTRFALRFNDAQGEIVTEDMRENLVGKLVNLVLLPHGVAADIDEWLRKPGYLEQGLKKLIEKCNDPEVADAFISRTKSGGGLSIFMKLINSNLQKERSLSSAIHALTTIVSNCSIPCWHLIEPEVYEMVVSYANKTETPVTERHAMQNAYTFLELAVSQGPAFKYIEKSLCFKTIIINLNQPKHSVQLAALALLNTLLDMASGETREKYDMALNQKDYRELLVGVTNEPKLVTHQPGDKVIQQIRHQLYKLQCHRLRSIEVMRNTPVDPNDVESVDRIREIVSSALGSNTCNNRPRRPSRKKSRDYEKLGFQNIRNPIEDFLLPPGMLALECMDYLINKQPQMFHEIILESLSSIKGIADQCPFVKSSIELSSILCDELHIGEKSNPKPEKAAYWPYIFQHANPFEELFCYCAQLVTKTWREMRARTEDFDKVFKVVRQQIVLSLKEIPKDSIDVNDFRKIFNSYPYEQIMKLNKAEEKRDKFEYLKTKPIMQLRGNLEPSIRELIKQNRLTFLMKGTRFLKISTRVTGMTTMTVVKAKDHKHWFWQLASDCRKFYYGDCGEQSSPSIEVLNEKMNIVDIVGLRTGRDCPHAMQIKKENLPLAFSIVTETEPLRTLDFIAPDEKTFNSWTDGINALIGMPMSSPDVSSEVNILTDIEVRIRTLNMELLPSIPQNPPPIPPPPEDFDFSSFL